MGFLKRRRQASWPVDRMSLLNSSRRANTNHAKRTPTAKSEHHPRDDYKELLDLCRLFIGAHPSPPSFRAPGPVHHARWMAKAIYSIKIWMFRVQFQLTAKEERGLRDMALFVVTMYAKSWFLAPNVLRAAQTDLDLLKALLNHPQHAIGKAMTVKLAKGVVPVRRPGWTRHLRRNPPGRRERERDSETLWPRRAKKIPRSAPRSILMGFQTRDWLTSPFKRAKKFSPCSNLTLTFSVIRWARGLAEKTTRQLALWRPPWHARMTMLRGL